MKQLFYWTPRVLSIALAAFIALLGSNVISDPGDFKTMLPADIMSKYPAIALVAVLALSWRSSMFGAFAFIGMGVYYLVMNMSHTDWVMTVSGPLLLIGAIFFVDWIMRRTGNG